MSKETRYTEKLYELTQDNSLYSAREIVPLVIKLLNPKSVIDVGCGLGTWLSVFKEHGVEDILGVDGDYVDQEKLQIPRTSYLSTDLNKPLTLDRQWDLVISLEVAEHLPSSSAESFVDSLTKLGKVILFSAAIPFQGGEHHINEQWQDYWAKLFQQQNYLPVDCIRRKVWQNDKVSFYYAQNTLIFAKQDYLENHSLLKEEFKATGTSQLAMVHPQKYLEVVDRYLAEAKAAKWYAAEADPKNMSLRKVLLALPTIAAHGFKRSIKNFLLK